MGCSQLIEEIQCSCWTHCTVLVIKDCYTMEIFSLLVTGDDVPEIDAAIFRGRRLYQELPAPAINHINGRDNTALRTALINNTFR
ncbi:hypothetical protein C0J52_03124 [Blattella germanica]|nr:hypothetical protein C0J52_03124 [Blattella germanica]